MSREVYKYAWVDLKEKKITFLIREKWGKVKTRQESSKHPVIYSKKKYQLLKCVLKNGKTNISNKNSFKVLNIQWEGRGNEHPCYFIKYQFIVENVIATYPLEIVPTFQI